MDVFREELHHAKRSEGTSADYKLVDNHRPVQKLYERVVYVSRNFTAKVHHDGM